MKITEALFRIADVETTGLDPLKDRIVELGRCDLRVSQFGKPAQVAAWSWLVNPGIKIPPEAKAVHHILDDDVAAAPSIAEVIGVLNDSDKEPEGAIYVAHNAPFDRGFLEAAGFPKERRWLDTWRLAMHVWPSAPSYKNEVLRYWLGFDRLPWITDRAASAPHRAAHDAAVTALVLGRALEHCYGAMFPPNDVDALIAWANEPVVLKGAMGFGKYFDKTWAECAEQDPGYLDWMIRGEDREPGSWDLDKIHTARHYRGRLV